MVFLSNSICDLKILHISNYGFNTKQISLLEELRQPPIYHLIYNSKYRGSPPVGESVIRPTQHNRYFSDCIHNFSKIEE